MNDCENNKTSIERLWDTDDVMRFTGWGRTYVSNLCTSGRLPYIPGKPHKFIEAEVKKALTQMQVGGQYGRRKAKKTKLAA